MSEVGMTVDMTRIKRLTVSTTSAKSHLTLVVKHEYYMLKALHHDRCIIDSDMPSIPAARE